MCWSIQSVNWKAHRVSDEDIYYRASSFWNIQNDILNDWLRVLSMIKESSKIEKWRLKNEMAAYLGTEAERLAVGDPWAAPAEGAFIELPAVVATESQGAESGRSECQRDGNAGHQ